MGRPPKERGLIAYLDVEGTPVVKTWHLVHRLAKVLSPAARAFRYADLQNAAPYLRTQDAEGARRSGDG